METFPENNQSKNDNVVKCIAVAQTWYINRLKWTWLLSIILTWANLLAAQETSFPTAVMIVPLVMHAIIMMHAVFSCICIVRLGSGPECEFPGCAVCPLPNALLLNIIASNPGIVYACSVQPLQDKVFRGVRGDRSQMAAYFLTEVFSVSPIFLVVAPEVAVVAVLLPAFFAGFNALVPAAV